MARRSPARFRPVRSSAIKVDAPDLLAANQPLVSALINGAEGDASDIERQPGLHPNETTACSPAPSASYPGAVP